MLQELVDQEQPNYRLAAAKSFSRRSCPDKLAAVTVLTTVPVGKKFSLDISKPEEVLALKEKYFSVCPFINILINAASIDISKNMEQLREVKFLRKLNYNLYGPFLLVKSFLPAMKEVKKGLIINIPGVLGKVPMAGDAAYSAGKYRLAGMIQSIREEIERTDTRIPNLSTGSVDSSFYTIDLRVQRDKTIRADEAAKAIWFLCQQPASGVVDEMVSQPFNYRQFDTAKSRPLKIKIFYPGSHFIIRSFLLPLPG